MAAPKTFNWSKLLVLLGDGATTEVFAQPCGLTSRGFAQTADVATVAVPDCTDPTLPTWAERVARSLSGTLSGSGVLAAASVKTWNDWFKSGAKKNCKIKLDVPMEDNGVSWEGPFILTRFEVTGNEEDAKMGITVELQSAGPIASVYAAV